MARRSTKRATVRELERLRAVASASGCHGRARLVVIAAVAVCAAGVAPAPQALPDIEALMKVIGERVAEYHRRAQSVMCVEQSTIQPIQSNLAPDGFSRTVESDLRVEFEADGDVLPAARVIREIRRINGRAPRERDKKDRAGCTDPNPLSPEPLAFLTPAHRDEYRIVSLRNGREKGRAALIIDFLSTSTPGKPELV